MGGFYHSDHNVLNAQQHSDNSVRFLYTSAVSVRGLTTATTKLTQRTQR